MNNKQKLALVLRIILGLIFIISAYSKIISTGLIEIILIEHGITSSREAAAIIVRLLIGAEFGLGLLFLQPYYPKQFVIPLSFLFLMGFTGYLVYTGFILRDEQNCGCFGEMISMSPVESIIKNIILLGMNIWLFILVKEEKKKIFIPIIIMIISITTIFIARPIHSMKNVRFSSYTSFEGKGRVDISYGDKLIAVFNTECEHCQQTAKDLAVMQKTMKWFPEMYTLIFVERSISVDSFKTITNSSFPYTTISVKEFFNLIGASPPRIYWLHDGIIKEKWDGDFIKNISNTFGVRK
jgi:hypothetical protein